VDNVDLNLPYPGDIDQLAAYVDAAHANCSKTRCFLGAEVFCLAGTAVYYQANWIIVICVSSTEAEFVVCVRAGKSARYPRSILNQLGLHQKSTTIIYVENLVAIMMANSGISMCSMLPSYSGSKMVMCCWCTLWVSGTHPMH
jgi:hypothetical protein